jgi:uncharacterized protein
MSSPRRPFLRPGNGVCDGPYEDVGGLYAEQNHVTHPFNPREPPLLRSLGELHEYFTVPPRDTRTLIRNPGRGGTVRGGNVSEPFEQLVERVA